MISLFRIFLFTLACLGFHLANAQVDSIFFENMDVENQVNMEGVINISPDNNGSIWFGTYNGLYKFDSYKLHHYSKQRLNKYGLVDNQTRHTFVDSDDNLWIAGASSAYTYNKNNSQLIRRTDSVYSDYQDLYFISYFDIAETENEIILATKIGLQFFSKELQKVTRIDTLFDDTVHDKYSTNSHVLEIIKDPKNKDQLYLLTRRGLVNYDVKSGQVKHLVSPFDETFKSMHERGSNFCIVGDEIFFLVNFLNLYMFNISSGKWTKIEQNIVTNQTKHIRNIIPYKKGFIAAYLSQGFYYYDSSTESMSLIPTKFLTGPEQLAPSFTGVDSEGHLVFIQNNERIVRSTEAIFPSPKVAKEIFVSEIMVNSTAIDTVDKSQVLNLKAFERDLSFNLGLKNRNIKAAERFFYKLDESEKWKPLENRNVELLGLNPKVKNVYARVETDDGIYESLALSLTMEKYFYEKQWFKALVAVGLLGFLTLIGLLYFKRKSDVKKYEKQLLQLEMDSLRSQMNPHFLFNSLNSIKNYLVSRSKDEAADYITSFSKLIRMILENSRKKFLTLEQELEMLKLYIEMENKRLNGTINLTIEIHPSIKDDFLISPMLIQPYVENAIWHGLMNKKGERLLFIGLTPKADGVLCVIRDNGVGRDFHLAKQHLKLQSKKSLGTRITNDRVKMINKIYDLDNEMKIFDLKDENNQPLGTEIQLFLPHINLNNHD